MMENIEYPWSRTAKSEYKLSDAVHQVMAVFLYSENEVRRRAT